MSNEVRRPAPSSGALLEHEGVRPETRASLRQTLVDTTPAETKRSYATALRYWETWHALRYGAPLEWPVPVARILDFICDHLSRMADPGAVLSPDLDPTADGEASDKRIERWNLPPEVDRLMVESGVKAAPGPLSMQTVRHRVHALATAHRLKGLEKPTRDEKVSQALKIYSRAQAEVTNHRALVASQAQATSAETESRTRGRKRGRMSAITRDKLIRLIAADKGDAFIDCRDRAMMLVAWSAGGRRRSEIANLNYHHLKLSPDGTYYLWTLGRTKTNQEADADKSAAKPIKGLAATALREWLAMSGITSGPVFRRIRAGKKRVDLQTPSEQLQLDRARLGIKPITGSAVYEMVRARAERSGLTHDDAAAWGAHSLRHGFVTQASNDNIPIAEIMAMTDHRSVQMIVRYYDTANIAKSAAANLLDLKPASTGP